MMFKSVAAVLTLLAAPSSVPAQTAPQAPDARPGTPADPSTPPPGLTWYVLSELNAFYDNPEDPTDRPELILTVPEGVIRPVDINHDGKTDWLIEWPESGQFCGTGGCERSLYVSTPEGFARALDRQTLDLKIGQVAGETRIEAGVHHLYCDEAREDCRFAWAWDDMARRLVQRPAGDGITLVSGVGPQPVDGDIQTDTGRFDVWPSALGNTWEASRVVCVTDVETSGYSVRHASVATIPDINGDGRPDWIVTPPYTCAGADPTQAFAVWTTTGEGERQDGVALAYTALPGTALELELAGPTLRIAPGCATQDEQPAPCAFVSLAWDVTTRSLK